MIYLLAAGILSLGFGLLLIFSDKFAKRSTLIWDETVLVLDDILNPYRVLVGVFLILTGEWMLYLAIMYDGLLWLFPLWLVFTFFGLLFSISPHLMRSFSQIANSRVIETDKLIKKFRRVMGPILLLASAYIFWGVYSLIK